MEEEEKKDEPKEMEEEEKKDELEEIEEEEKTVETIKDEEGDQNDIIISIDDSHSKYLSNAILLLLLL